MLLLCPQATAWVSAWLKASVTGLQTSGLHARAWLGADPSGPPCPLLLLISEELESMIPEVPSNSCPLGLCHGAHSSPGSVQQNQKTLVLGRPRSPWETPSPLWVSKPLERAVLHISESSKPSPDSQWRWTANSHGPLPLTLTHHGSGLIGLSPCPAPCQALHTDNPISFSRSPRVDVAIISIFRRSVCGLEMLSDQIKITQL